MRLPTAFVLTLALASPAFAKITVYPRQGAPDDDTRAPHGPGLILMGGGTDVDAAFDWAHDRVGPGGDVVVLRASGTNAYDTYLVQLAPFQSAQTLLLEQPTASELAQAAAIVSKAEVVFFAGGDQAKYVAWKGTPLLAAVQAVYDRGGVIGGTSAGMAILGSDVFDAIAANAAGVSVQSSDALADPFAPTLSFSRDVLSLLPGTITDPHFAQRDRFGRLAVFVARTGAGRGIGVDEATALVIEGNQATLLGSGHVYLLHTTATPVAPFVAPIDVTRIEGHYDLQRACGEAHTYTVPTNSGDPYDLPGTAATCPSADAGASNPVGDDAAAPAPAADDAGVPHDEPPATSDSGCGCTLAGSRPIGAWPLALLALIVVRKKNRADAFAPARRGDRE